MGISSCLDPRHRLAFPDTPPELVSPGPSSYSSRRSEDRPWNSVVPLSPPMSHYDPTSKAEMSSGKSQDETQARRDGTQQQITPRQQLPSLSSLFGPPPARPLNSPLSDRPGSYTSASSHDRPFGSAATLERSYSSSSYFPSGATSSISQPRSTYEPRCEDRAPFPPLSRPFPGPLSPRARDVDHHQRPDSRSEFSGGSKWSIHQDPSRQEYSLGSRDALSCKPSSQITGHYKREEDAGMNFREQRTPQTPNQHLPSTPSSIVTSEGVPAKDGLGPKIWTGTHFLPRFVRAAEVPGEGMCYFYDDGSHCKTVIDGEAVNAHWGVTKAGKPRKRLAIACVTCREKKIKCDPDYPRCVQCEKFGRVCKFKNAPRGGHNTSPSTPPAEPDDVRRLGPLIRPPPPDHPRPSSNSSDSVSPRTAPRLGSPEMSGLPPKRLRVGYGHFTPTAGQRSPMGGPMPETTRSNLSWQQPELPRLHEDVLCRAWQTDPYVSDPQSVTTTISSFFVHADATALRFLPERVFKMWVQSSAHRKSPEDLMLVYSILAVGVALSGGSRNIAHEYSQVARYATERAALSLQLAQARILLCLYYLSASRPSDANDMSSAAISAATCLQLNLELDRSQDGSLAIFPFNMTRAGYAESRRRTFWSCLILERLDGLFPTRISIINTEDIFIRLPADLKGFEDQMEVPTPAFEPHFCALQHQQGGLGIMGYLVQIVVLWGDVMTAVYRIAHRNAYYNFDFIKFHHNTISRLEDWKSSLPQRFLFSPANLDLVPLEDKGSFILTHLAYHLTIIKLHRHIHPRFLTASLRYQYSWAAREHARSLLDVVCAVAKETSFGRSAMPPPFTSYAILEAIDVLSAEGPLTDLPQLVDGLATARSVLEILATVWDDAKVHRIAMDHRLDKLANLRDRGSSSSSSSSSSSGAGISATSPIQGVRIFHNRDETKEKGLPVGICWQMADALEGRFPKEMDCVYTSLTHLPMYS